MLRIIAAGAVVLLAVALTLVGYNALILGTGLAGALAFLKNCCREVAYDTGLAQHIRWITIIAVGCVLAWRASYVMGSDRY
jgi:hypothetical protein